MSERPESRADLSIQSRDGCQSWGVEGGGGKAEGSAQLGLGVFAGGQPSSQPGSLGCTDPPGPTAQPLIKLRALE